MQNMKLLLFLCILIGTAAALCAAPPPQASAGSGTLQVQVTDTTGAIIPGATVTLSSPATGYKKSAATDASGTARITSIPPHKYHLDVTAPQMQAAAQDVEIRSAVPVTLTVPLQVAAETTTVEVHAEGNEMLESVPMAHTDVDRSLMAQLPIQSVGQGVTDVLTLAVPGVVKDSDGFVHPLGDHAEMQYSVDNQPITNQQNKQASNQMPLNAVQSFEAVSGAPPPEFGDKASLVVTAITKSGLASKPFGSMSVNYGSFGTYGENITFGGGNAHFGNFLAVNSSRSGRYLDTPEFRPMHDAGNNEQIFNRTDWQMGANDTLHLNLFLARSWFQIPNTFDQKFSGQDQRQQVRTFNISPGWIHSFGPTLVMTVNPFVRQDHIQYYPSRDAFDDLPATISQDRRLTNAGVKADLAYVKGIHNAKAGLQITHDILRENFALGITDPGFNAPCISDTGEPVSCSTKGSVTNPDFQPGLLPFDLTRGGRFLQFRGRADIKEYGFFAQDVITLGNFSVMAGLRGDIYRGLSQDSGVEPRVGVSYMVKQTATVIRASYSRFFETPYNENLVLSSSTGLGGLQANALGAFAERALAPGRRNQYQAGLQQGIGKHIVIDSSYFWKYTTGAYDFDTLFNTPIAFPIEWRKSKVDGLSLRVNLAAIHGFSAYTVLGHTRARFFGPEIGGLIFNSPVGTSVFRIDHDQALEQTTNLRYQYKKDGPWVSFTWRYDSGQVAGSVPDLASVLSLTADQQHAIGFFCGSAVATIDRPLTSAECNPGNYGATRVRIPKPGTENDDTNPPRIAPRHLFDVAIGFDNLFHTDTYKWTLQLSAVNLTNEAALYNFLSTFSGTHFVAPRSYRVEFGVSF